MIINTNWSKVSFNEIVEVWKYNQDKNIYQQCRECKYFYLADNYNFPYCKNKKYGLSKICLNCLRMDSKNKYDRNKDSR